MSKAGIEAHLFDAQSTGYAAGVVVCTAHLAEGLEFDAVIVPDVSAKNYESEMDRNLLYVACTRAMHKLTIIMAQALMPESHRILLVAQDQHRCVVEAIANREGARAEAIMQEHARLAGRNLQLALRYEKALERVPGDTLIRT